MVQVRRKHLEVEALRRELETLLTGREEVTWILNRHVELAAELGLDGVHVGGEPGAVSRARKILGDRAIVGYSAHAVDEARQALERGADYVSLSPIFAPLSKTHPEPPRGLEFLREASEHLPGPVYALGGITPERVAGARRHGAHGVAVLGAIQSAENPENVTRELLEGLASFG